MGTGEEIQSLRQRGMTDGEIIGTLKGKGIPESEIVNSLSQSKIKDAVTAPGQSPGAMSGTPNPGVGQMSGQPTQQGMDSSVNQMPIAGMPSEGSAQQGMNAPSQAPAPGQPQQQSGEGMQSPGMTQEGYTPDAMQQDQYGGGDYAGMQPSMMAGGGPDYAPGEGGDYAGGGTQEYSQMDPMQGAGGGDYAYDQYQPYQEAMSTDVITEIAEQVVNEKLSYLRDKLESVLDIRTVMDARMTNLNERLRRIEKIMDQLQLSVLQKVGEYVNDVRDIKKEMEETQKSFSALHKRKHSKK